MIRYPEKIRHREDSTLLSTTDIMPTMLALAGLGDKIPDTAEGRNLAPVILENGEPCDIPDAALYIRNTNGPKDKDGLVRGIFPEARGVKTHEYSMEITINKNHKIERVLIFNDIEDPYQLENISWKENPELFRDLCTVLAEKLEESNDIWYRENILGEILANI